MRISDWSSDVCSSDLNDLADRVGDGRAEKPVLAQSDVERRQVDKSMADRGIGAQLGAVQGEIDRPHMTREREQATADDEDLDHRNGMDPLRPEQQRHEIPRDRKSVVEGKSVSVRVDLCGRSIVKKKTE